MVSEESVLEIAEYCRGKGMSLSVENLHLTEPLFRNPEEFETFSRAGLGLTLDVAHAVGSGVDPLDFVTAFGAGITEVHLADGVRSDPLSHYPVGAGEADCLAVLHQLGEVGFDGTVIIEVDSAEDATESLRYLQRNGFTR